ncbi:MAG: N-acetyltransferase, partial [Pseudomonadota bacterium]|nr:N-acetyltransferase [Pseudomonadota bacterium]
LGPIAVEAAVRSEGLGAHLVQACVDHARMTATGGILLVGDRAYFERFGFVAAPDARLPGPVDQRRVLWLAVGKETAAGGVRIG